MEERLLTEWEISSRSIRHAHLCLELHPTLVVSDVPRLLFKLSPNRRGDHLAVVDHPAGDRPLPGVLPLDHHDLQLTRLGVVPRDDGIRRLVGAPLSEQASPSQPGAPRRIQGRPAVKLQGLAFAVTGVRDARLETSACHVRGVCPPVATRELAIVVEDALIRPLGGCILREGRIPANEVVGHRLAASLVRLILLTPGLRVPVDLEAESGVLHRMRQGTTPCLQKTGVSSESTAAAHSSKRGPHLSSHAASTVDDGIQRLRLQGIAQRARNGLFECLCVAVEVIPSRMARPAPQPPFVLREPRNRPQRLGRRLLHRVQKSLLGIPGAFET